MFQEYTLFNEYHSEGMDTQSIKKRNTQDKDVSSCLKHLSGKRRYIDNDIQQIVLIMILSTLFLKDVTLIILLKTKNKHIRLEINFKLNTHKILLKSLMNTAFSSRLILPVEL